MTDSRSGHDTVARIATNSHETSNDAFAFRPMSIAPIQREPESTHEFVVSLELLEGYAFRVAFDDAEVEPLHTDETPPLGKGTGPSPSRLLAAAVANCLAASLAHCLRRARV